jgi:hypothetical protein
MQPKKATRIRAALKFAQPRGGNEMNTGTGASRRWHQAWTQRVGLLAVMAGVAVLTLACGGNSASTGSSGSSQAAGATPSASSQASNNAVAFAQCMRAHGIPNYPDPSSVSGPVDSRQLGVTDTVYESARTTCYRLYPQRQSGPGLTTAQQQQVLGQLLNFAKCMRSHGLPAFPDPNPASTIWGSGGGQTFTLPSSINPNSSQFTSAENACKSLKPSSVAIRGNKGGGS